MKTYIVDIDNTICYTENSDYFNSKPIYPRIQQINKLYDEGYHIIYWTARGSASGKNWESFTTNQLDAWGCKRHDIKFNKPKYDLWIDDKSANTDFFNDNY